MLGRDLQDQELLCNEGECDKNEGCHLTQTRAARSGETGKVAKRSHVTDGMGPRREREVSPWMCGMLLNARRTGTNGLEVRPDGAGYAPSR